MKKFLSLLLILIFTFSAYGSLSFANDSTDRADCGSAAALDNLTAGTVVGWMYITSVSGSNCGVIAGKGSTAFTGNKAFDTCPAGGVASQRLIVQRNTTDLDVRSTNWLSTGTWYFLAYSFDTSLTDTDQHLYMGTLTTTVAEETAYVKQQVGSGTVKDDSANSFDIGNIGAGTVFEGGGARRIAFVGLWGRQLSLAEIKAQQFHPHLTGNSDLGMWFPGSNGTGTQPDYTGNANNCTVTGATQSDHVPIGPVFGYVYTGPLPWSSIYARAL
jgi:hypothetical protein